eukprot:1856966-Rhodomonas_salina.2
MAERAASTSANAQFLFSLLWFSLCVCVCAVLTRARNTVCGTDALPAADAEAARLEELQRVCLGMPWYVCVCLGTAPIPVLKWQEVYTYEGGRVYTYAVLTAYTYALPAVYAYAVLSVHTYAARAAAEDDGSEAEEEGEQEEPEEVKTPRSAVGSLPD